MITLYTQPGCQPCKQAKQMLLDGDLEEGIDFVVLDIAASEAARDFVVNELGAKSTPVITSWSHPPVLGFSAQGKKQLAEIIEIHKAPRTYGDGTWLH